jgi:hypothetical protein
MADAIENRLSLSEQEPALQTPRPTALHPSSAAGRLSLGAGIGGLQREVTTVTH